MKIVRFMNEDGKIHYGIIENGGDDKAFIIEGDIFKTIRVTDKTEKINVFLSPIDPPNIFALGFNYGGHAEESDVMYPERPIIFMKANTSVIGHGEAIVLPQAGPDEVDYEAELAVVIGKTAKNITPDEVERYILGYTCGNDISARDWQFHKQKDQWTRGKSFDTFCPLGPWLVTADEINDPNRLNVRSLLNGQIMQDSNTARMIFHVASVISDLSKSMTLQPGTVIMTGTPDGVGFTREPPVFLKDGDTITVEVEHIGQLTNPVKMER